MLFANIKFLTFKYSVLQMFYLFCPVNILTLTSQHFLFTYFCPYLDYKPNTCLINSSFVVRHPLFVVQHSLFSICYKIRLTIRCSFFKSYLLIILTPQ